MLVVTSFSVTANDIDAREPLQEKPRLVAQLGHPNLPFAAIISPDRRYLISTAHSEVIVWERETGREIRRFTGHKGNVKGIAVSPSSKQVAIASDFDRVTRLWNLDDGQLVREFKGHSDNVTSVAFHPDGQRLLTGSVDGTARLWNLRSGDEIKRLTTGGIGILSVAISPDGRLAATGGYKMARIWDLERGVVTMEVGDQPHSVESVAFHPTLPQVMTTSNWNTPRLWDLTTGKLVTTFSKPKRCMSDRSTGRSGTAVFSPSGDYFLTVIRCVTETEARTSRGIPFSVGAVEVWETASGLSVHTFDGEPKGDGLYAGAFSGEKQVITVGEDIQLRDIPTGKLARRTRGTRAIDTKTVGFSKDSAHLWVASKTEAQIWDAHAGQPIRRFALREFDHEQVAKPSPDGNYLVTGHDDGTVKFNDIANGGKPRLIAAHKSPVNFVSFSETGDLLITAGADGSARVWRVETGELLKTLSGHQGPVGYASISADGRLILTGSKEIPGRMEEDFDTVHVWDFESQREISRFDRSDYSWFGFTPEGHRVIGQVNLYSLVNVWDPLLQDDITQYEVKIWRGLGFAPDGKHAIGNANDGSVVVWDIDTGKVTKRFTGHTDLVVSVDFSPDGTQLVTASNDRTARIWDWATEHEVALLKAHDNDVRVARYSQDGRMIATAGNDHTVWLWDAKAGNPLTRLISFGDGQWAVIDPLGRFDASRGGEIDGLHWVVANEPIALSQLKARYYDPGLLGKKWGTNPDPLRPVELFANPELFPTVDVSLVEPSKDTVRIRLTNRGGGIGRIVVNLNGKEVTPDARGASATGEEPNLTVDLPISGHPYLLPGKENEIEVRAYNAAGYLTSRGLKLAYNAPGKASNPPTLWALVVGVSDYEGSLIDLRYAAKDAADIAAALDIGAKRLFGAEKVNLQILLSSTNGSTRRASKKNLEQAFGNMRAAGPQDVVVVYLAGHGVVVADDYHFLTEEARSTNLEDPEVRRHSSISSAELVDWLKQLPALKQVMILDTCAAGKAASNLVEKRNLPSSQVRAIERLTDRVGLHVLMGSAADAVSYEATQYQQGLLTYALLQGMKGPALREEAFIDVSRIFEYAADEVPRLALNIGGIQRPVISAPMGQSFDVGQLTTQDRVRIPLSESKRLLINPIFQSMTELFDSLALTELVRERLREVSYSSAHVGQTGKANSVYVNADAMPRAIRPSGAYWQEGTAVVVEIVLVRDGEKLGRLEVRGDVNQLDVLAKDVVESILVAVDNLHR